jgi:hypothetical protein
MKKILNSFFIASILLPMAFFVTMPSVAFAQNGQAFVLRPDCNEELDSNGNFENPCGFDDFVLLIRNIIRFIVLYLSAPIMALGLAYSGFLIMTSGASSSGRQKAKDMMWKILQGFLWAIAAWLIVETIFSALGYSGFLQFN